MKFLRIFTNLPKPSVAYSVNIALRGSVVAEVILIVYFKSGQRAIHRGAWLVIVVSYRTKKDISSFTLD